MGLLGHFRNACAELQDTMPDSDVSASAKAAGRVVSLSLSVVGFVLLTVVPAVLAIFSPWGCERFTDAYPLGMQLLRDCPLAVEALGDAPDKTWGFSNFEIDDGGQTGRAFFTTKVAGTKQHGEYHVAATRTFDVWSVHTATLMLPGERRIIQVKPCLEMPQQ
jgi:hypothetical protein